MHNLPFDKPGQFYKGNLHTHSTCSDGVHTPERVCQIYRELGYDFLSITDHFMQAFNYPITDTRPYRTSDFTTLIGSELHTYATITGELWHILAVGLPLDFPPNLPDETGPELAARALATGAYVVVAHPAWYNLTEEDVLALGPCHAIETINGIAADHNDKIDSWYMLDVMLARGYRYNALTTDDAHMNPNQHDVGRGWVWVKSAALEPDTLLESLKAGHYYCSSGPQIFDIQLEQDNKVRVRCSPVSSVFVTGKGWYSSYQHGNGLTEVELSIKHFKSPYCRVTVRDPHGGRAWSNPIWL